MNTPLASCLYEGAVRHRRRGIEVPEQFRYSMFMLYLDLSEIESVFSKSRLWSWKWPAPAWFRRSDFIGDPSISLDEAVRNRVQAETGKRPTGPIRMLAHVRYWGMCFNPVTFYYCFDPDGDNLETIVAEVNNTPWNERHAYVLSREANLGGPEQQRFRFAKQFHVSPFLAMDYVYDWRLSRPGDSLVVHMENQKAGRTCFDATLTMKRREITGAALTGVLLRYPLMTLKVIAAIYWQALRLLVRRAPFYPHPDPHARIGG